MFIQVPKLMELVYPDIRDPLSGAKLIQSNMLDSVADTCFRLHRIDLPYITRLLDPPIRGIDVMCQEFIENPNNISDKVWNFRPSDFIAMQVMLGNANLGIELFDNRNIVDIYGYMQGLPDREAFEVFVSKIIETMNGSGGLGGFEYFKNYFHSLPRHDSFPWPMPDCDNKRVLSAWEWWKKKNLARISDTLAYGESFGESFSSVGCDQTKGSVIRYWSSVGRESYAVLYSYLFIIIETEEIIKNHFDTLKRPVE